MKKQPKIYVFYMGIAIFAVGMVLKFLFSEADGAMLMLPFVLIGFGSGIIGVGVVNILGKKKLEHHPAILSLTFVVLNNFVACWVALGALFIHIASLFVCSLIYSKKF